jgi:hypothetical protein
MGPVFNRNIAMGYQLNYPTEKASMMSENTPGIGQYNLLSTRFCPYWAAVPTTYWWCPALTKIKII